MGARGLNILGRIIILQKFSENLRAIKFSEKIRRDEGTSLHKERIREIINICISILISILISIYINICIN